MTLDSFTVETPPGFAPGDAYLVQASGEFVNGATAPVSIIQKDVIVFAADGEPLKHVSAQAVDQWGNSVYGQIGPGTSVRWQLSPSPYTMTGKAPVRAEVAIKSWFWVEGEDLLCPR